MRQDVWISNFVTTISTDKQKSAGLHNLSMVNKKPSVHPTALVIDSVLGVWTEVGARTSIKETVICDYSYVDKDSQIIYAEIGKFCSIA